MVNQLLLPIHRASEKTVPKVWGLEGHIINNDKFCLKYLIFYKGGKLSLHCHKIKTELFHCITGKFGLQMGGEMQNLHEKRILTPGDKVYLTPETYHSLECFEEGIIVEVSTTDRAEDSYRLVNSSFNPNNEGNIEHYK
jgi:mannose-6-phosphate isomerase-like protein (cupin superfamily)